MQQLASHARIHGGAGLIIDYGALKSGTGDTLQAVRRHKTTDPLADPGETDLTTHVDFEHLAQITQKNDVTNLGVAQQGAFLLALGLLARAGQLGAGSDPATQDAISLAVERLAGDAAMGKLFKVMGFASTAIPLPGLEPITTLKEFA
jgi:SAM-dependent MidA family methyltransferase